MAFDKSIEMDPKSPLPYINKGIYMLNVAILNVQWKQESSLAETLCKKAIEVDPLCDIAYTQLAQLLCLSNRLEEAIEIYEKAIKIARTEAELVNVISMQEAALAQEYVIKVL
jgi:import receptor subunit TOM70